VLLAEHEEDLARLGGFLAHSSLARSSTEEAALRRFWHRVPWLLVGLTGAVLAADIVASFAETLEANVMLAFFIPGIVYLADAVGTQTETVVVRGLSLGVRLRQMFAREIAVGLLIGLALAATAWPLLYARWGNLPLALGVSLALFAACSSATLAAMCLPWLLDSMAPRQAGLRSRIRQRALGHRGAGPPLDRAVLQHRHGRGRVGAPCPLAVLVRTGFGC
jgi:magnesium transporter